MLRTGPKKLPQLAGASQLGHIAGVDRSHSSMILLAQPLDIQMLKGETLVPSSDKLPISPAFVRAMT
jgi:hypothetical protein